MTLTIDEVVDRAVEAVEFEIATACEREGTAYDLEELWSITHTEFSPDVRDVIETTAKSTGTSHQRIVNGAGHDASYLNEHTATGMVFVPSEDGKTHSEAEYTEWTDVLGGTRVFANTVLNLAN
ncbi:M20/M25/M40 family metallo-hydrolase [Halegenticoccus tardaugens]|uniref:M20/M25/M40 family metallo-hydrolase n=1 Tax=Halegenticoccus tardaugens TaxID=2071624 RepID=UPI00100BEDF2|nr:M20/M25/M40 family metallo-hydrolase [Halegenticoccus tardaugens]